MVMMCGGSDGGFDDGCGCVGAGAGLVGGGRR